MKKSLLIIVFAAAATTASAQQEVKKVKAGVTKEATATQTDGGNAPADRHNGCEGISAHNAAGLHLPHQAPIPSIRKN
jgi:hypothetical protein